MRYADDARQLARAVADLVAAGPAPAGTVPDHEQETVLSARDAVVTELRDLTAGVLGRPHTIPDDLLVSSPPHALHAALSDLPLAAHRNGPPTEALAAAGGPLTRAWQNAARAAVALERYHDQLAALPGPDAWAVVRDAAVLAAALPHLDADLASAMPTRATTARNALLSPDAHGLVRLAADELLAHTTDLPDATATLAVTGRPRVGPVRGLTELPGATATLTALLQHRGGALTALEARATVQALTKGVDLTARLLHATSRGDDPAAAAAGHLHAAVPHLQRLLQQPLATLTPPAASVPHLAQQIRERLTTASALADCVQRSADARPSPDLLRLAQPLARWAAEVPGLCAALQRGLQQAADSNRLLAPRTDTTRGRGQHLLWLPLTGTPDGPYRALSAAAASTAALSAAARPLATLIGAPDPSRQGRDAVRAAARDAGLAFANVRSAVQARARQQLPNPARPAHPAAPAAAGLRRAPQS